jgi:UrcA family protein
MLKHHRAVACAVAAAGFSVPALSQSPVEVEGRRIDPANQRIVRYADLNLATAHGERTLMSRIRFAVRDLCVEGINYSPIDAADLRICRSVAWASARPQLDRLLAEARSVAGISSGSRTAMTISIAGAIRRD